jgi:hypothetical protein
MSKKSDARWACTNQLPSQIPLYKAPRLARGQDKRIQDKRPVTARDPKKRETTSTPVRVVIHETEQKDCDSEDETEKDMSERDDCNIPFSELKEKIKQDQEKNKVRG